jgi:beta-glucosidase
VAHHLLLSHGRAVEVLRHHAPGSQVGIVLIQSPIHPASDSAADHDAARALDGTFNRWFLDPLHRAAYPEDVIADRVRLGHLPEARLDFVQPGDMACIATPTDFLGINYYSRIVVKAGANGVPESVPMAPPEQLTDMGWEVYPQGLREVLARVHRDYAPASILVTENGAAYTDEPGASGQVEDVRRVEYLRSHLAAARQAIADGVPLTGYFAWSFMDNFEWGEGLAKRFGLFHVDYETQRRTPRESAYWYRETIARGAVDDAVRQHNTRRLP